MSDLDDARESAARLLRKLILTEARYVKHGYTLYPDADKELADLARQYVSEQARYTNMLRDWEKDDA